MWAKQSMAFWRLEEPGLRVRPRWLRALQLPFRGRWGGGWAETLSHAAGDHWVPGPMPPPLPPAYLRAFAQGQGWGLGHAPCLWVTWAVGQCGWLANPGIRSVPCQISQQQYGGGPPDKMDYSGVDRGLVRRTFCGTQERRCGTYTERGAGEQPGPGCRGLSTDMRLRVHFTGGWGLRAAPQMLEGARENEWGMGSVSPGCCHTLISGGLSLQRLEAGSRFPDRRLKPGRSSAESRPLGHEGQWPPTRPWLVCFVEMNLNKETESSETSKVFIRRKNVRVDRHIQAGSEKESCPWGSLNHLYGAFLPVSSGQSSWFAWL